MEKRRYKAEDFSRYYSGKMSPIEMHRLEKAALEDPMLGAALEGYELAKYPEEEMKVLRERLRRRTTVKEARVQYWKIAVILVLFLGAGFWMISNKSSDEPQMAITETQEEPQSFQENIEDESPEPAPVIASAPARKAPVAKSRTLDTPKLAKKIEGETGDSSTAELSVVSVEKLEDTLPARAFAPVSPLQDTVQPERPHRSFLRETAPAAPLAQKPALLRPRDTSAALRRILQLPQSNNFSITNPLPSPEGGWENFDRYLSRNKPAGKQTGSVTVEFVISLTGYPTKIVVVRSTCASCERAAVVLVRDGPRWKNSPDGKGEVTIYF